MSFAPPHPPQPAPNSPAPTSPAPTRGRRILTPGLLSALISTLLVTLALPTFEWWPLLFIALIPLYLSLPLLPPRRLFLSGWLAGALIELILFRWIPFTMGEMTSLPGVIGWAMLFIYALWHGLRFGVFLALAGWLTRRFPHRHLGPFLFALSYTVIEWLWPALFPWPITLTLWSFLPAVWLVAFQAVPWLTFALLLFNATLAENIFRRRLTPWPWLTLAAMLTAGALTLPSPSEDSLRIAILQPNYSLEEKKRPTPQVRAQLLDRFEAQLLRLQGEKLDLIVASEGAFPFSWRLNADNEARSSPNNPHVQATRRVQRAIAQGPQSHAVIGGLRTSPEGLGHNSAVLFDPQGKILSNYDKKKLVPFSETIPLSDTFPALKKIRGIGDLTPGEGPCQFDIGTPISCGICYEGLFPDSTLRDLGDGRLLINLTIDTWFGTGTAPRFHLATHALRALELGVPLVRSALTGISAAITPRGHVLAATELDVEDTLILDLPLAGQKTVYRQAGQLFAPLATLVLIALMGFGWRRQRR